MFEWKEESIYRSFIYVYVYIYIFHIHNFYLFLAALGLCCCTGSSLVVLSRSCSPAVGSGFLIAVASLAVEHRRQGAQASVVAAPGLWSTGWIVAARGLSCFRGCSQIRDQTRVFCIFRWILHHWAIREAPYTDFHWLTMGLCSDKHVISWKYIVSQKCVPYTSSPKHHSSA